MLGYGLAASAFLIVSFVAADAGAFCRSTTCRGELCTKDANECPETGARLFWATSCLPFSIQKRGTITLDHDEARRAIFNAFQHWSDVACPSGGKATMTFTPTDEVPCKKSQYNPLGKNVNVIMFQDEDWKYRGLDATLAKTSVTFSNDTGEIYDADIEINTANNPYTTVDPPRTVKQDLEAVLTHEVGHFLGLAHSLERSVMRSSYSAGSIAERTLQDDDIEGLCTVYPPERDVVCNSEPRGGMEPTCDDPPPPSTCSIQGAESTQAWAALWPAGAVAGAWAALARKRGRRLARDASKRPGRG